MPLGWNKKMNTQEQYRAVHDFIEHNYRHFNSAVVKDAAKAYVDHLSKGGKMFISLAGAMSTAELGITLADMIRNDKIHGISCTGANLEEDIFNLVANSRYERIPNYRYLTLQDEEDLLKKGMNRVTDTCIPEDDAFQMVGGHILELWQKAEKEGERYFPYEYMFQLIRTGALEKHYDIDTKNSWIFAACEKNIPIFVGGWEDSTLGNIIVPHHIKGDIKSFNMIKTGLETFEELINWYRETSKDSSIGFFQIGGGIAGDFPICVVPSIRQELKEDVKLWGYFCQISDSTTSYGSYSGATPNEKITWEKISKETPGFVIESDATIVAPLIFAYVLASNN